MKATSKTLYDPDQLVRRGSLALIRHARRKHLGIWGFRLAVLVLVVMGLGLISYLIAANVQAMPWRHYLDRFDFRLQTEAGQELKSGEPSEIP